MLSKNIRPWVCVLPQPGWGGSTLEGFIEAVGLRPEIEGTEEECTAILDGLVAAGHAKTFEVTVPPPEDAEEGTPATQERRWELTDEGHDALTALIEPEESATVEAVLLELQPGVGSSEATTESEAK